MSRVDPNDLIAYGPDANCVLDQNSPYYCPASESVYGYRPTLGGNIAFLLFFFIVMVIQIWQGLRFRSWFYMGAMIIGCICEILGYAGRIMLWQNPFSFTGFMIQIIMITLAPAFYSAAIYVTLSKTVMYLGQQYSRFPPMVYYWLFIPCDIISLVLQGTGGGMSSSSNGSSQTAVDIAIAGLSFQVVTLVLFIGMSLDFCIRYVRGRRASKTQDYLSPRFKVFVIFMSLAIVLILIRCSYRIYELRGGYTGPSIRDQGLFIALESVMVTLAAFCLCIAHPGPVLVTTHRLGSGGQVFDPEDKVTGEKVQSLSA